MTPPASAKAADGTRAEADTVAARLTAGDHVALVPGSDLPAPGKPD